MEPLVILTIVLSVLGVGGGVGYAIWYEYRTRALVNRKVSDQAVIEIARENHGKITVALLCEHTGLTASEAKTKLKYLAENKVIVQDWKSLMLGGGSYVLPTQQTDFISKFFNSKGNLMKRLENLFGSDTPTPSLPTQSTNKDAQIISLAIENQGITSASAVCVKLNISIEEAQKRLEDLRQKQIFITEVGQNGGIIYRLMD